MPYTYQPKYCYPFAVSSLALAAGLSAGAVAAQESDGETLEPVVVSGDRTETSVSETTRSVSVIDREDIERQASVDSNLSSILAQTVPGMAPSTEALTNFGQTIRGRKFLVLIDGIPQSTPLRDASRGLNTIAPSSIERIEVVRGGTSTYGFGGAGGLINIITKEPSGKGFEAYSKVSTRFDTSDLDESADYETEHRVSGTQGRFDYLVSASYADRGGRFDGEGDRIPPDPLANQGGLADTEEFSVLAKGGIDFDGGDQRLELMINHYENEQDSEFTFGPVQDGTTTAIPLDQAPAGRAPAENPGTENTAGRITYRNQDLLGSDLRATAYGLDQEIVFGNGPTFLQSGNSQEKYGLRTTIDTPIGEVFFPGSSLTWGFDYLRDETDRVVVEAGGTSSSPGLEADAAAAFTQLEVPTGDKGLLRMGLRYETIGLDVASLDRNGARRQNTRDGFPVQSGSLRFNEMLLNVGAVMYATDQLDVVTNFSQGFSLANFGRTLRGARPKAGSTAVDPEDFASEVQTVNQLEIGLRYYGERLTASTFVFGSKSENGTSFDNNLSIRKRDEEIWGIEGQADYRINGANEIGGTFSWSEGVRKRTASSTTKVRLPGTRIPPLKVTGYWQSQPTNWWDNRLQATYVGNRTEFDQAPGFGEGDVDEYIVFDLTSRFDAGPGKLGVSVRNLLDNDYKPAINQAFNIPSSFANASGRRFGLSYELQW